MKASAAIGSLLVLLAGSGPLLAQRVYDVAKDFSLNANPNPPWVYGWLDPFSGFSPYTVRSTDLAPGLIEWRRDPVSSVNGTAPPNVMFNSTPNTVELGGTVWRPNEVTFHPAQGGEASVVRWIAPNAGGVTIHSFAQGNSPFTVSGFSVYHNNQPLFSGIVPGNAVKLEFNTFAFLNAGDAIDFRLDTGNGDWGSDTTRLSAIITVVPEPGTLALLATGTLVLLRARRFRSAPSDPR